METGPLTKELVPDTALMHLNMKLSDGRLDVMLYNPLVDHSLIYRSISFPADEQQKLKVFEDFIYDNPVLTSEFAKTNILIAGNNFTVLPLEITDTDLIDKSLRAACPDMPSSAEIIVNSINELGASFVTGIPAALLNFIRRTFINAPVLNHLVPLARYFSSRWAPGSPARMLVNLQDNVMDVVVTGSTGLLFANSLTYRENEDAVYYIVALCELLGGKVEEILISGNRVRREELTARLRTFHPYVMPMIFPSSMFRAGTDSLSMPFDLVIMPLCE